MAIGQRHRRRVRRADQVAHCRASQDQLRGFRNLRTRTLTLHLLLQSQRKIKILQTETCIQGRCSTNDRHGDLAKHYHWMRSCHSHIVDARLWLGAQDTEALGRLSFALETYFNLKVLELLGADIRTADALPDLERSFLSTTQAGIFTKLTHLHLVCLAVARGSHCSLLSHLDVPNLQMIELARCDHISPFLRGLISTYATTEGSLTSVLIILPWDMAEPHTALQTIEDFLKACPKLHELAIDVSRHGLLRKNSILPTPKPSTP